MITKTIFGNESSQDLFIGDYSLDEVIAGDKRELAEINGSFNVIANRMQEFINFIEKQDEERNYIPEEEWMKIISPISAKYRQCSSPESWLEYGKKWAELRAKFPQTHIDDRISVISGYITRGFQQCPFENCQKTWNDDVRVYNRDTKRDLTINKGTEHLVREHSLLEKGNQYGIGAKEFYEHFIN